jgi:hypothetical protein
MKNFLSAALSSWLLSLPFSAFAVDISGQSRTYLQSRQDVDGTRYMPLYEYLNFSAGSSPSEDVSFHFGGWYRHDFQNELFGTASTGDLQYAYLSLRRGTGNSALSLGRVLVNEGVISSQMDGLYARTDLKGGFRLAAYGGSPVETDGDTRSGDSVYGGRISHGIVGIYAIGVSYLQEKNDSKDFRKEEGVDLWLRPFGKLEVMGKSSYNAISKNWMQHQYTVLFGPFGNLRLSADASKVYYKEYFSATTLSAFTFPNIDPNETVTTLGGSADYAITPSLSAGIDFKNFDYTVANNAAKYYGVRIAYTTAGGGAGLSAHRMDGPTARLQYDDQRAYVTKKLSKFDLTLDVVHLAFKEPISGVSDAYTGTAAAGYSFSQNTRLVADVEYAKTPDYNKDVRSMLTFVYSFDAKLGGSGKPAKPAGTSKPPQKKP